MVELLVNRGGDVNSIENDGLRTPLHFAISPEPKSTQRAAVVRFLLAQGANVNSKDKDGWTPLFKARKFGANFDEIAEILIAHGGKLE
jgi:ankyrin repeat protein